MNEKWFSLSVEEIEKKLRTNAATGLHPKAARARCNRKEQPFFKVRRRRWDKLLIDLLRDFFLVMLVLVAIFSLCFEGEAIIGSAMLVLIVVNLALSFFIYYRDRKTTESMSDFFLPTARVIRGGKLYIADYRNIVPGDVIVVEKGDILGCDARLILSNGLSVKMKTDGKNEKLLQKLANGAMEDNVIYVDNMVNMLHAGSVVEAGSGRAIVVATGQYTYMGAMMGGYTEIPVAKLPESLARLHKTFSKLGTLLLVLTLPFSVFSLLFSNLNTPLSGGGEVLLSQAFGVALTIGSGFMLSRFSNVLVGFFSRFVRRNALSDDPCIMRSAYTYDRLADMDYLFLLDGSITTDGILHFDSLMTADGEARGFEHMGQTAVMLTDMIALYNIARRGAVSVGMESNGMYDTGLAEFMKRSGADVEALNIRCPISSFLPQAQSGRDTLVYTDKGERREVVFSYSSDILAQCESAVLTGMPKPLTEEGKLLIQKNLSALYEQGKHAIIVALKAPVGYCFVGLFVLNEGIDVTAERAVNALKNSGVKVILFSNCVGRTGAPEIPQSLKSSKCAHGGVFLKQGKPITYGFGEFDEYTYIDESMIAELATFVKSQGKTLAVLGFSDYAQAAIAQADVFVSCAPVRTGVFGRLAEEIRSLEIPGEQGSASCTQKVKARADVLLMRPQNKKGGLEPLAKISEYCKISYRNLKNFLLYLLCVQSIRIVTVAIPMLWGQITTDVRQLLFLSFVLDFLTMLVFMRDTRRSTRQLSALKKDIYEFGIVDTIKKNSRLFVSALLASLLTLILPPIVSLLPAFGPYSYKAEYMFTALVAMQITALFCIYSGDLRSFSAHKRLVLDPIMLLQAATIVFFMLICLVIRPIGDFFGIVKSPLGYFLISLVPSFAFAICYFFMSLINGSKKQKTKGKM